MDLLSKEQKNNSQSILSTTKPSHPILNARYKQEVGMQTKLKQKKQLKIYIEDNKYFVEHSAAYALGLTNTRAIMMDTPKLVEITGEMHNKLRNNDEIIIEYIKIEKKSKLKVYVNGSNYCIDNSTAYALGILTVGDFYNENSNYYYIDETILINLKQKYDIEIQSLNLTSEMTNKSL